MSTTTVRPATGVLPNDGLPPRMPRRISWGAIFAGAVIAIAVTMLLTLLGVGIGAATIDPVAGDTPSAVGGLTGSAIFFGVVQLIALFIGGYAAARLAGVPFKQGSMLHGATVWALATFAMFWLASTAVGTIAGGLASTLSKAGQGVASAAGAVIPDDLSLSDLPNLDMDSLPQGLRNVLENQGISLDNAREETISAFEAVVSKDEQAQAEDVATDTAREVAANPADAGEAIGDMVDQLIGGPDAVLSDADREQALAQMQERLGISEEEAQQLIDETQARIEKAQAEIDQAVETAKAEATQAADTAAEAVSTAAFGAFAASLLGLIAAVVGSMIGRPKEMVVDSDYA